MGVDQYKILLDTPSNIPALGFSNTAKALKNIIQGSTPQFSIGIFGEWGSGKTTLMRTIQKELDADQVISIWFSAWRYEREEHLIIPLLDTVQHGLEHWASKHSKLRKTAKKAAADIRDIITTLLAGISIKVGVPGAELGYQADQSLSKWKSVDENNAQSETSQSLYHRSLQSFSEIVRSLISEDQARRIVVFVDDLDRCLPIGALRLIESMKLSFDIPGFIFVVGVDRTVIEWSIEAIYASQSGPQGDTGQSFSPVKGSDYIKKIFQIYFTLSALSLPQAHGLLHSIIDDGKLPKEQEDELKIIVLPHSDYLVSSNSAINPREIKRYVNSYVVLRKTNPNLESHLIITILTIAYRHDWKMVLNSFLRHGNSFISALQHFLARGETGLLTDLGIKKEEIPVTFLEYISEGKPGNILCKVNDVEAYLKLTSIII